MKTLEKLLAEYKIRFMETEEIDERNYPFGVDYFSADGSFDVTIQENRIDGYFWIRNNYGIAYFIKNGVWVTAKITEKPRYKVGDKVITQGYSDQYDGDVLTINRIDENIYCFFNESIHTNHNFEVSHIIRHATQEDFDRMYEKYPELTPPKEGDWCVFWDESFEEAIEEGVVRKYYSKSIDEESYTDVAGYSWKHCIKLSSKLSEMLEKEINQIKNK